MVTVNIMLLWPLSLDFIDHLRLSESVIFL